jgi:hypothetical protein
LPLLVKEDFEHGMDRWRTTDPDPANSVWKIIASGEEGNHVLRVTGPSQYEPPYRSPLSIAWLKDVVVGDFNLTARVQNTNVNAGPHRDLCLFWERQDPSHFYYVHLGAKPDPYACQIFIVNGAPRTMITQQRAEGTAWTDGWHNVKVVRRTGDGPRQDVHPRPDRHRHIRRPRKLRRRYTMGQGGASDEERGVRDGD